jgi:uncharacterized membrane protein YebE (DUF533 family)
MEDKTGIAFDSGYKSRKLIFAAFTSILIIVSSRITSGAALGEVITGLVTLAGIYITGNVVTKWKAGQIEQAAKATEPEVKPEVKPEDDNRG